MPRGGELLRVRGSLPELRGRPHRAGQGQARAARRESRHQCKSRFLAVFYPDPLVSFVFGPPGPASAIIRTDANPSVIRQKKFRKNLISSVL